MTVREVIEKWYEWTYVKTNNMKRHMAVVNVCVHDNDGEMLNFFDAEIEPEEIKTLKRPEEIPWIDMNAVVDVTIDENGKLSGPEIDDETFMANRLISWEKVDEMLGWEVSRYFSSIAKKGELFCDRPAAGLTIKVVK